MGVKINSLTRQFVRNFTTRAPLAYHFPSHTHTYIQKSSSYTTKIIEGLLTGHSLVIYITESINAIFIFCILLSHEKEPFDVKGLLFHFIQNN